jgi:hypothetical protein
MVLVISYVFDPVPVIQLVSVKDIHLVSHPQEIVHLRMMMALMFSVSQETELGK